MRRCRPGPRVGLFETAIVGYFPLLAKGWEAIVPSQGGYFFCIVSDNPPLLPYALVRNFGLNTARGRGRLTV